MDAGFSDALRVYLKQSCSQPAISLALLYCTVLSFGLLSTAYLKHLGLSEALLSVARGAGAVSGLMATLAYPRLRTCLGAIAGGCIAAKVNMRLLLSNSDNRIGPHWHAEHRPAVGVLGGGHCATSMERGPWTGAALWGADQLAPHWCVLSLVIMHTRCCAGGLIASRFGLWLFDLVVLQTMQEQVPGEILGQVNGVQGALQQLGELAMFVLGVAMPQPEQYPVLMLVSFGVVTMAALVFMRWVLFGDREERALRAVQYQRLDVS